ncbi:MAG: DUF1611 domain-containing protein, partial [Ignavibacteria bacterium]|nr:DUF1611 domain-containing protein [Ignavibacteria bacterium]
IYYSPQEVLGIFDRENTDKTSKELFGTGDVKVISSFEEVRTADTLVIGVATAGGKIPKSYRPIILEAISRGMNVIAPTHEFLTDDSEIKIAAEKNKVQLIDLRKNNEKEVAHRRGIRENCLRIQTVGNDCSLGKMIVSLEITNNLKKRNLDAKFVATGQTGILIEGDGIPIDAVVGDYINGAAEKLVLKNQHHDIIMIEGQGSLFHPRYSSVTLGLLHGSIPHGLIMCYEMGREYVAGMEGIKLPSIEKAIEIYEQMASIMFPCKVIGIAINSRHFSKEESDKERERIKREFNLPACDVIRHGSDELADAIIEFQRKVIKKK